jgi:hypothetical protein
MYHLIASVHKINTRHYTRKVYGELDMYFYGFLTLALVGGVIIYTPQPLYPRE